MFCVNFSYSRIGWPQCQECWYRDCFSANLYREPYYYVVMEEVRVIPWNYNPKDELRYKHLTNSVHLFMPFFGPIFHFFNIQYRLSTCCENYTVFMIHITRCILDAVWGRKPSIIKNHLLDIKRNFFKCKYNIKAP